MKEAAPSGRQGAGLVAPAIVVTGALILLWSIVETAGLLLTSSINFYEPRYVVGYLTIVPACLFLMWGGRWLSRSDLATASHRTVGLITLAGTGGFLLFNILLMLVFPTESVWLVTSWTRWALSLGLCLGLVVGISYSRKISEELSAERHAMRAEHLQQQRDLINDLNGILRHEVLNAAQIIEGNATLLGNDDEPIDPADQRIERIRRQGAELTTVIDEVRALLNAVDSSREFESCDLSAVLQSEIETIRLNHPSVDVETDIPDSAAIEADALVGRVFGNLLRNAVEHNDAESLTITVRVEVTGTSTAVTIADDGDGIPDRAVESLFDRPQVGTHGLGLYIVKKLVDSYGGSITLTETGPDGTRFTLRFPRADPLPANE